MNIDVFTRRRGPGEAAPMTVADLLHDVRAFILCYVRLSLDQATLLALWVVMTHAIDAFDYVAYVHVNSPVAECGKSRLLEVLEALVANPWRTDRVTAAVLMRRTDQEHPVLLLDESDAAFNGDEQYTEALRGMLNAGFHRKGKASVCVGQGSNLTYKDFSVFGPKVIAGIGRLPSTVESRSIPIAMKKRTKDEPIRKWRDREGWETAGRLREPIIAALAGKLDSLRCARPDMLDGLSDCTEDVLEPPFAIGDLAGGEWPKQAREPAHALVGQAARVAVSGSESGGGASGRPEADLRCAAGRPGRRRHEDHPEKLHGTDDRPWATFSRGEKPLTPIGCLGCSRLSTSNPPARVQIEGDGPRLSPGGL